jgi:broad specificity phosphatase PhoE
VTAESFNGRMPRTMTRLLLVRHGETDWNVQGYVQGGGSLNDQGHVQAIAVAKRIKDLGPVDLIMTSPTQRTQETAGAISECLHTQVEARNELTDLDYGVWARVPLKEAREAAPDLFKKWAAAPHTVTFPGGGSLAQLQKRVLGAVWDTYARFPTGTLVWVTHDSPIRVVVCHVLGLDDSYHYHVKTYVGSLTIVDITPDQATLVTLNE